jgi:hypothetical protein
MADDSYFQKTWADIGVAVFFSCCVFGIGAGVGSCHENSNWCDHVCGDKGRLIEEGLGDRCYCVDDEGRLVKEGP